VRQMPQIFINGQHVGGLAGLHEALTKKKKCHAQNHRNPLKDARSGLRIVT